MIVSFTWQVRWDDGTFGKCNSDFDTATKALKFAEYISNSKDCKLIGIFRKGEVESE